MSLTTSVTNFCLFIIGLLLVWPPFQSQSGVKAQFDPFDIVGNIVWERAREAKQDREYRECVDDLDAHCYYKQDKAESFKDINEKREELIEGLGRRKKRADVINCYADGSCISQPSSESQNGGQNRDTCCGICKSCTFENCCHCSFADKDKYCPMPGWRASDYTGKNGKPQMQPRAPQNNNHRCMDIVVLAGFIYRYMQVLQQRSIPVPGTNWETAPYIRRDWAYVVGRDSAGLDVRPNDGHILERAMDHNGLTRTEILERNIRPQDLRTRNGGFTTGQRQGFFASHNGVDATDQMGHILGNTLGGPNTLANCFPQHVASNNNVGGADPNAPNWVATEYEIRNFLSTGSLSRYVQFRVHLVYPNTTTGRPSEIIWSAIFMDSTQTVNTMGGRILNDGSPHSNICNATNNQPGGK